MASKQKARYVGPDGGINYDVARDTRRGSRMQNGEVYEVSEELFAGLMLSADWEPESGSSDAADEARNKAKEQYASQSQNIMEGASYAELVASQEEDREAADIKTPIEASIEAAPSAEEEPAPRSRKRKENNEGNGGGEES